MWDQGERMVSCAVLYLPWGILEISQASDAIVTGLLFVCLPHWGTHEKATAAASSMISGENKAVCA